MAPRSELPGLQQADTHPGPMSKDNTHKYQGRV
jgi:hypothetical protein